MSLPLAGERIVISHLFADLLNLYGDHGNIATLVRRAIEEYTASDKKTVLAQVRDNSGRCATINRASNQ